MNDPRIDHRTLTQHQTPIPQITVDDLQNPARQLMFFQQSPEVEERLGRLIGNVQLYTLSIDNESALLIRGINPIKNYATTCLVDEILDCIIACATDLAIENGFSMVCVAEQNGLWNSNSNRPEIRAALARRLAQQKPVNLNHPFHLYTYYATPVHISCVYPLWRSGYPSRPDYFQ